MASSLIDVEAMIKARKNLLEIMEHNGYDVNTYAKFTKEEIIALMNSKQLDMLLTKPAGSGGVPETRVFVYHHIGSGKSVKDYLGSIIDDLFEIGVDGEEDKILKKDRDILYILTDLEPNFQSELTHIWKSQGIYIIVNTLARLQFNILKHQYIPPARILSPTEQTGIAMKYNVTQLEQFPRISRYDPLAVALCVRPGQMIELINSSKTSGTSLYYRVCVDST